MLQNNFKAAYVHPASLMLTYWSIIYLIYFLGPINISPEVSFTGFIFISTHILLFVIGSFFAKYRCNFKVSTDAKSQVDNNNLLILVLLVLTTGIIGGILSVLNKLSLLEHWDFLSIAHLRSLSAQRLLLANKMHVHNIYALGLLLYPAGYLGVVCSVIYFEQTSKIVQSALYGFICMVCLIAIVSGGRSALLVLFVFIFLSCILRKLMGLSFAPKSLFLKAFVIIMTFLFLWYSNFLWSVRTKEAHLTTSQMLQHSATVWGATPGKKLQTASKELNSPKLTQSVLSTTFYLTQTLSTTERMLVSKEKIPLLFGSYHIDLVAALFRTFPSGIKLMENGYQSLMDASVYGYFAGAWTALFIDFGALSFIIAILWGYLSGVSWLLFKLNPNLISATMYVFWIYAIFISFVSPPLGFSNSLMIYFWFLLFNMSYKFNFFNVLNNALFLRSKKPLARVGFE